MNRKSIGTFLLISLSLLYYFRVNNIILYLTLGLPQIYDFVYLINANINNTINIYTNSVGFLIYIFLLYLVKQINYGYILYFAYLIKKYYRLYENITDSLMLLILYSLYGTYSIILHNDNEEHRFLCASLCLIVSISDILQYFFGKNFGTTRPISISPNKTIEGYIGGLLTIILFSPFYNIFMLTQWVLLGFIGDLFVSLIKREMGIKDISNLLGDHGGLIDRLDGIFMASIISINNFY